MALVALGGYGRSELYPFSDIDLLLLYDPSAEAQVSDVVQAVFYPLWDTGLEVGHGVRTVEACLADARKDFFLQVALLDARFIVGDMALFNQLETDLRQDFVEGRRRAFVEDMLAHRAERYRRFGLHSYLLEPDIKESRGGLRDLQAMLWTAQVLFGLAGLPAMEEAGLLMPEERLSLEDAWEALIRIRNRLHYVSGRKNDRLYFEHQEQMAKAFGHHDADGMLAVEHFMREVYGHMRTVAVVTTLFFEHAEEVLRLSFPTAEDSVLEAGIEILDGCIHLTDLPLLEKRPYLLMRVFVHAARTGLPVHYRTRKLVSAHIHLIDEKLRRSRRMAKAFLEVLQEAKEPLPVLEAMLETGLFPAYIPEFRDVESLAQHDVYHAYTVDRHLLQTVSEVRRLQDEEKAIFMSLASPHVLYLAALLHDIGKGHGHGHAERGAGFVEEIGERLGLLPEEVACLAFVVRDHLFLVNTALRRDLEDEAFILRCARAVEDPDRLNMLYLLSIADSRATGPGVWTDWKAALVLEFYLKIAHLLERSDLINPDRVKAVEWMREQVSEFLGEDVSVDPSLLPEDYLLSFAPEAIVRHMHLKAKLKTSTALVYPEDHGANWSVLIMAQDRTGLLARICGVLALHNLNVLAAQIFTLRDGTAVDVLEVRSLLENAFEDQDWNALRSDLHLALDDRLGLVHRLGCKYSLLGAGASNVSLTRAAQVVIDNQTSDFYTVLEVYAADRVGLLYDITRTLAEFGINIFRAKIGTRADQVVDVFYVLDKFGVKIVDRLFQEEIRQVLLHVVNQGAS